MLTDKRVYSCCWFPCLFHHETKSPAVISHQRWTQLLMSCASCVCLSRCYAASQNGTPSFSPPCNNESLAGVLKDFITAIDNMGMRLVCYLCRTHLSFFEPLRRWEFLWWERWQCHDHLSECVYVHSKKKKVFAQQEVSFPGVHGNCERQKAFFTHLLSSTLILSAALVHNVPPLFLLRPLFLS